MPDAYGVHEGRYIDEISSTSAADATQVSIGPVPANTVWTVLAGAYYPSAAETKTVTWYVTGRSGVFYPVTAPSSIALAAAVGYPLVREGMEFKLFPAERLWVLRDSATAGSTMTIQLRLIASALPIYEQYEPQVRRAQVRRMSSGQRISSGGGVGSPGGSGVLGPGSLPGEGGGGEPVV